MRPFWSELRWEQRNSPEAHTGRRTRGVPRGEPALSASSGLDGLGGEAYAPGGLWDAQPSGWLLAGYGSFRRLSGDDDRSRHKRSGALSRLSTLFDEDASLADGVTWLVGRHLRALEGDSAAAELKRTALAVLGDGLLPDDCRVVDVDSEGLWVERDGRLHPLREMSDGLRTVTALVVDLLRQVYVTYAAAREAGASLTATRDGRTVVTVPGVVLIDEVDAHLHVSWQRRIGPWLTSHFPGIQFLVTTHSPYICQSADPGGLIRLPGPGERRGPRTVDEDLYERVVYGSGDDAALSELFGLDSPYSERAEGLRAELVALETRILRGTADDEALARYTRLKKLLTSSPSARLDEMSAQLSRLAEEGFLPLGEDEPGIQRVDNITDATLRAYQSAYSTDITQDDIFYYTYALLHSPQYRDSYASDLKKALPRIPMVRDFHGFAAAGRELAELHIGYEKAAPHPGVAEEFKGDVSGVPASELYRVVKMKFGKSGKETDRTRIVYNSRLTLTNIPEEAYRYQLGARSAIEWIIDRYQVKTDKASGIANDPNHWSDDPRCIVDLLKRIVTVSLETMRIVDGLPPLEVRDN